MIRASTISAFLVLFITVGCEDGFDPKGSFEKELAVFSVLRSVADSQYVRIHATYDPPAFDPLEYTTEPDLSGAVVTFSFDTGIVSLAYAFVPHPDPRYGTLLRIFYAAPFVPQRGLPYTLSASVAGYPVATSTTIVPRSPAEFHLTNTAILSSPRLYETQNINLVFNSPPEARGFLPRLYVEYEVQTGTPYIERAEIPFRLIEAESETTPDYPDLQPLELALSRPFTVTTFWSFQTDAYQYQLSAVAARYGLRNIRFRRVIMYLYQVDENAYKYYNIVNGFRDDFSIRTDLPDYSNVSGGVGIFGAISLDSLSIPVSSTIQF